MKEDKEKQSFDDLFSEVKPLNKEEPTFIKEAKQHMEKGEKGILKIIPNLFNVIKEGFKSFSEYKNKDYVLSKKVSSDIVNVIGEIENDERFKISIPLFISLPFGLLISATIGTMAYHNVFSIPSFIWSVIFIFVVTMYGLIQYLYLINKSKNAKNLELKNWLEEYPEVFKNNKINLAVALFESLKTNDNRFNEKILVEIENNFKFKEDIWIDVKDPKSFKMKEWNKKINNVKNKIASIEKNKIGKK